MRTTLPDRNRPAAVLLCSVDAVFREHLTRLLSESGDYRTVVTAGPAEALCRVVEQPPDLFICSHEPPGMDGIGLVTALRANVWVSVLLAAKNWTPELAKAAVTAKVAAFLTIYPTQAELSKALHEAKARMEHEDELGRKLHDVEQRLIDRKLIEKAKGLVMERDRISEDAAFRLMRNQAMTRRISMAKLAEGLLTKTYRPDLP